MVSTRELFEWTKEYDTSKVFENELDLKSIDWNHCFSSDLYRAKESAKKAFDVRVHI